MPIPFLVPIGLSLASALAGAFGAKKASRPQQTTTRQTTTSVPTLDPQFQGLQGIILPSIMSRLQRASALPAEYEQSQISGINRAYDLVGQDLENRLTSAGLAGSPVAGTAYSNLVRSRAGDIVRMQQQLPLLERQLQAEDLDLASRILGIGRGTTTTGESIGTVPGVGPGPWAAGIGNLASTLGWLIGAGAFKRTPATWSDRPFLS